MHRKGLILLASAALALVIAASSPAFSQEDGARYAAVVEVHGDVQVQVEGTWQQVAPGMRLHEQDQIRTLEGSSAVLLLVDGKETSGQFKLREKTQVRLDKLHVDPETGRHSTLLDLAVGKVLVHVEKMEGESKFEVKTPVSTTGVRGTDFSVGYDSDHRVSETAAYSGTVAVARRRPAEPGQPPAREVTEPPVLVRAGTRTHVDPEFGVREPSPLSPDEMTQGLRESGQISSLSIEDLRRFESNQEKNVRKGFAQRGSGGRRGGWSGMTQLCLYLTGIGLVLIGIFQLLLAVGNRSLVTFLLACALITSGAVVFRSNDFRLNDINELTERAAQELKVLLRQFTDDESKRDPLGAIIGEKYIYGQKYIRNTDKDADKKR